MIILLSRKQAESIGWNDESKRDLIRSCFYLGYGSIFTAELVANEMRSEEAKSIMDAAYSLGMSTKDIVSVN